jgi:hypothetical protein
MRTSEITTLLGLLDRVADEHPQATAVPQLRNHLARLLGGAGQPPPDRARAEELADLRRAPLGNALFTRASFEAEYGPPELVGAAEEVDLAGGAPAERCIYCEGERFSVETYATDRQAISVRFWWCHGCGLGHAVSWGSLGERTLEGDPPAAAR